MQRLAIPTQFAFNYVHRYPYDGPPLLPVEIAGTDAFGILQGETIDTYAKLDTGASGCVFPADFARRMRINLAAGELVPVEDFHGDSQSLPEVPIMLRICGEWMMTKAVFDWRLDKNAEPIIGREGVFPRFGFALFHQDGLLFASHEEMSGTAALWSLNG